MCRQCWLYPDLGIDESGPGFATTARNIKQYSYGGTGEGGGGVPKHEQHNLLLIEASQNRDGE